MTMHKIQMGNVRLSDVEGAGETSFNPFEIIIPYTKITIVYEAGLEITHHSEEPEGFQRLELAEAIAQCYKESYALSQEDLEEIVLSELSLCDDGKYRLELQVD